MKKQKNAGKYAAVTHPKKKAPAKNKYALVIKIQLVILAVLVVIVGGMTLMVMQGNRAEADFQELAAQVQTERNQTAEVAAMVSEDWTEAIGTDGLEMQNTQTVQEDAPKEVLPQYLSLYEENADLYGWIQIENTRVDYPVMHTPEEPEKYLHLNFDGEYSFAGVPFLDAKCKADSDNLLIYGHNMTDGSMFRGIMKYQQKDYWQRNPIIKFNTLYEEQEYEVLAAFYDRVYYKTETCFKFYQFIDAVDEADFNNAVEEFRKKALYDTGVEAVYGDQLITLITCSSYTDNGRFVVVAVKK